jgi:hypothetical protein
LLKKKRTLEEAIKQNPDLAKEQAAKMEEWIDSKGKRVKSNEEEEKKGGENSSDKENNVIN